MKRRITFLPKKEIAQIKHGVQEDKVFFRNMARQVSQPTNIPNLAKSIFDVLNQDLIKKAIEPHIPKRGVDYFTDEEKADFLSLIQTYAEEYLESLPKAENGEDGKDGRPGRDGIEGPRGFQGLPGADGRLILAEEIRDKLHSLIDTERLNGEFIQGILTQKEFEEFKAQYSSEGEATKKKINTLDQRWHGGGISKVSTDSTLKGNGTPSSPLSVVSGGSSSGFQLPLSGAVNGSNQTYTWTTAPNAIVVDGVPYIATSQDGTVNWTISGISGLTTTLVNIAPNGSIFSPC